MDNVLQRVRSWYRGLPDKKRYVEFVTALLTVPVLMTVLITNISSLNNNKKNTEEKEKPVPTVAVSPTEKVVTITERVVEKEASTTPTFTPTPTIKLECKKEVGPVKISTPMEGQLVDSNPVCINVAYQVGEYCAVAWSYRLQNNEWSDYSDKQICLYNLPVGPQSIEVRVKSGQSDDEVTLIRNFYYKSKEVPPTATPTVAPSITATP